MKFTLYFENFTTGEIVCRQQNNNNAYNARDTFRRYLRSTGALRSGDSYKIVQYDGERDLRDIPNCLFMGARQVAR